MNLFKNYRTASYNNKHQLNKNGKQVRKIHKQHYSNKGIQRCLHYIYRAHDKVEPRTFACKNIQQTFYSVI